MKKIVVLVLIFLTLTSISFANVDGDYYKAAIPEGYEEIEKENQLITRTFVNNDNKIRIYNQHLGIHSFRSYIEYGNEQIYQGKAGFSLLGKEVKNFSGLKVELFTYKRPLLTKIENDQNFYIEGHVYDKTRNRAITVWGKTNELNSFNLKADIEAIFKSMRFTNEGLKFSWSYPFYGEMKDINLKGEKIELSIPKEKTLWGRFYPGYPFYRGAAEKMADSEKELDHFFEFIMTYKTFPAEEPFPIADLKKVYDEGRVVMLTLQPFSKDLKWIAVPEFIEGDHDDKIIELAKMLKELNEPVFVRPINEMNGDWDPWCAWFFGKDTDLYIKAWQHIVELMREHGGDKLQFVWNPHDRSYPDFNWNNAHMYYPGDEYVDWVGLTGYNNGTSHPGDVWREFDPIYKPLYNDYLRRYSSKPFIITEFSTNEVGGDKGKWIEEGFKSLAKNYPNIKIAVWFDGRDGLWEYQIDSTEESFNAFKEGMKNPGFASNAVSKNLTK